MTEPIPRIIKTDVHEVLLPSKDPRHPDALVLVRRPSVVGVSDPIPNRALADPDGEDVRAAAKMQAQRRALIALFREDPGGYWAVDWWDVSTEHTPDLFIRDRVVVAFRPHLVLLLPADPVTP